MKKLLTFLTLLTLFFTTAGAETVYYFLDGNIQGGNQDYGNVSEITQTYDETVTMTWDVYGNTKISPWRIGGKGLTNVNRTVANTTAMGSAISKVSLEVGTVSSITVNSLKLIVASDANFSNKIDEVTRKFVASSTIDFTPTTGTEWATGAYYKFVFNVSAASSGNNKFVQFIGATFYLDEGGTTPKVKTPTFSPGTGRYVDQQTVTISCATPGASIMYSTNGSDYTAYSQPLTISGTTHLYAKASLENYDPSDVGEAIYTFPATVDVPPTYNNTFKNQSSFEEFFINDVSNGKGSPIWTYDSSYGAVGNGRSSTGTTNVTLYNSESWLISPYFDLTNATSPQLSFKHAGNRFTNMAGMQEDVALKVRVLNGTEWSAWTPLTINTWPTGADWNFVDNTTSLQAYKGKVIQLAFIYTSTTTRAGVWEITDFKLENITKYNVYRTIKTNGSESEAGGWLGDWSCENNYNGSSSNYDVTPTAGDEVTFKAGTNDGYQIFDVNISAVDENTQPVTLTKVSSDNSGTVYKFTMPSSNVTITANFTTYQPTIRLAGRFNGRPDSYWMTGSDGPAFQYDPIEEKYTMDVFFTGAVVDNNENVDFFWFRSDNEDLKASASGDYWLTEGETGNIYQATGHTIGTNYYSKFRIYPGIYTFTINKDRNKLYIAKKDVTFTFTPPTGSTVNQNSTVTATSDMQTILDGIKSTYDSGAITATVSTQVSADNSNWGATATMSVVGSDKPVYAKSTLGNLVKTGEASYTVQEVNMNNVYYLVEDPETDLVDGGEYLIIANYNGTNYALSTDPAQSGSNTDAKIRTGVSEGLTIQGNMALIDPSVFNLLKSNITLEKVENTDYWKMNTEAGYLYLDGYNNYLKVGTPSDDNEFCSIDVDGSSTIVFKNYGQKNSNEEITRFVQFNYNNGAVRFACYASNMTPVYLYKKAVESNTSAKPTIAPQTANIKGGLVNVTLSAKEGAAIYYTTNGDTPDPENPDHLYGGEAFPVTGTYDEEVTVKAIAVEEGKEPSAEASFTYTFSAPSQPVINPSATTSSSDITVVINNPNNAGNVYYVINPSTTPETAEDIVNSTDKITYTEEFTLTGIGEYVIYAAVELNGLCSMSNKTCEITEPAPEGEWKLVKNDDDIQAGREYIFVVQNPTNGGQLLGSPYALTTINYLDKYLKAVNTIQLSEGYLTATPGENVATFTLEGEAGEWMIHNSDAGYLYNINTSKNYLGIGTPTEGTGEFTISIDEEDYHATITETGDSRILGFLPNKMSGEYNPYFALYENAQPNDIHMYYRGEVTPTVPEVTLAWLCENGSTIAGENEYIIKDKLIGVYADEVKGILWCKDLGPETSIFPTHIKDGQVDFLLNDPEAQNGRDWDQSNWIALQFSTTPQTGNNIDLLVASGVNRYIKPGTVRGKLIDNLNYTLLLEDERLELVIPADGEQDIHPDYIPNVYCPSNFVTENLNIWNSNEDGAYTTGSDQNYFFMNPKIQEICEITYAQWNEGKSCFTVPGSSGFDGEFYMGTGYNVVQNSNLHLVNGKIYKFKAIVNRTNKNDYAPKSESITSPFTVFPIDLMGDGNIITAINTVEAGNGEVKGVKYVNVAGMVSDRPFQGVNIVVTEYTDGTSTTSKMFVK